MGNSYPQNDCHYLIINHLAKSGTLQQKMGNHQKNDKNYNPYFVTLVVKHGDPCGKIVATTQHGKSVRSEKSVIPIAIGSGSDKPSTPINALNRKCQYN